MAETILSNPLFVDIILPFLLVFAIVFAVLQKSEIFGKGKKQSDAIIALVVGLIVVTVGTATDIIVNLMPVLAVGLVVLLVFMLLWGFAYEEGQFKVPEKIKWIIGVLAAVVVVVYLLRRTPGWKYITDLFSGSESAVATNFFVVIVVIAAIVAIVYGGKKESK